MDLVFLGTAPLVILGAMYLVWVLKDSQTPLVSELRAWVQAKNPEHWFWRRLIYLSKCPRCLSFWCVLVLLLLNYCDRGATSLVLSCVVLAWLGYERFFNPEATGGE